MASGTGASTPRRPSTKDVARRAGVSQTAVSFVLTGRDKNNIAPATRERILSAAADLGYRPNRVAQSLRRQRTQVIGLVTDSIASSPFAGRLLGGAIDRGSEAEYVIVVFDCNGHPERERAAVEELENRGVDGLIYATMGLIELRATVRTRLPLVLANCFHAGDEHPSVLPDDTSAGRAGAHHLLELGHRRVTMLSGQGPRRGLERDPRGNMSGPLRSRGFRAAMRQGGVPTADSPVISGGWDIQDGYQAAHRVLTDGAGRLLPVRDRPTALLAVTDRVATGVLLAAARLGLDVPGDLSVVGFDDQEALAANVVPALTTLALPHAALGSRAVELLLRRLHPTPDGRAAQDREVAGEAAARREHLPFVLVTRESAGPPP